MAEEGGAPLGRRERKKAETRARLIDSAYRLIDQRGYDTTSLADIAEAADVSARTFYLYFDSKADVALARFHQWVADLVAALEARPAGEPPDRMLAAALRAVAPTGNGRRGHSRNGRPPTPVVHALLLAEDSPEVAGGVYRAIMAATDQISTLFGRRLGYAAGSIEADQLAAGLVGAFVGAQRTFAAGVAAGRDPGSIDDMTTECFSRFGAGLAPLWEGRLGQVAPAGTPID